MPLVNCKIELKLKWAKYCLLSAAGTGDINNIDSNNIVFTIRNLKFYVPVGFLSARNNQKLSKLHSKNLKDDFIGMNIKEKVRTKLRQMCLDILSNQILVEPIDYLF